MRNLKSFTFSPATLVYVGLAVSMLGVFPLLGAFGIIGQDGGEPAAIAFGILFGAVFGGSGGLVLYRGLSILMVERLGMVKPSFSGLLRLVWMRVNRKTIYAALPYIFQAAQILYVIIVPEGLPWLARYDLQHLVVLEFFAIHATAFLGLIAFVRWRGLAMIPQIAIFLGLLAIYSFTSYQVAGPEAAIGFALLTLSKYIGYAVKPLTFRNKGKVALRWLTGLLIFVLVSTFFDVDLEMKDNLLFAAVYFLTLATFEIFDLMAPDAKNSPVAELKTALQEDRNA